MFAALDERAKGHVDALLEGLSTGVDTYQYDFLLPKAILTIAQHDAIIVGRAAHLFLPDALRVRVVAPLEARVSNLVKYDSLTADGAQSRIALSDAEREAFVKRLRGRLAQRQQIDAQPEYDLLVNTGKLAVHDATALIADVANAVLLKRPRTVDGEQRQTAGTGEYAGLPGTATF
jgi:cytidylate kinase